MTVEEYRRAPGANYSSLKWLLSSPAHYLANLNHRPEETSVMRLGTMLHSWWLEGKEDVLGDAVVKPDGLSFSTKEGKAWRDENQDKFILTSDEWTQFLARQAALKASSVASALIQVMPDREKPLFGEIDGVPVKALFDALSDCAFIDLKTCQKNDPKSWGETVLERHYALQTALYREIWKQNFEGYPTFYWITVSADPSPVVAIYWNEPFISIGEQQLAKVIKIYKDLQEYGEQPLQAELPFWYKTS